MEITSIGVNTDTEAQKNNPLRDEFLRLFVTQLRYQDPLSPLDSKDMTAQLAQFSSLEQLQYIKMQLADLLLFQNSLQNTLTVSLIGREVSVEGDTISLDVSKEIRFRLSAPAEKVKIQIYDSSGNLVREVNLGRCSEGENTYTWDGYDNSGNPLPDGLYRFSVEAYDQEGSTVEVQTFKTARVTAVTFQDNITYLVLDDGTKVQLNEILSIGGV